MKKTITLYLEQEIIEKLKKMAETEQKKFSEIVAEIFEEKMNAKESKIAEIEKEIKEMVLYSKTCLNLFKIETDRKNLIFQAVKENPDKVFVVDYKPPVPPAGVK